MLPSERDPVPLLDDQHPLALELVSLRAAAAAYQVSFLRAIDASALLTSDPPGRGPCQRRQAPAAFARGSACALPDTVSGGGECTITR
jgi:hypothetical protein